MIKSKKRNILMFIMLFISQIFYLTSCLSNASLVPGQKDIVITNIYIEYSNIGDAYCKLEDYTNAAKYYEMALKSPKIYWSVYYKLAKTYALSSNWEKSLDMYNNLFKRDPENNSLKASLAYIYSMQGNTKEAQKIYSELLEIDTNNEKYLENYIAVLMPDLNSFTENESIINENLSRLKENFPENKNIERFDSAIQKFKNELTPVQEGNIQTESESVENTKNDSLIQ